MFWTARKCDASVQRIGAAIVTTAGSRRRCRALRLKCPSLNDYGQNGFWLSMPDGQPPDACSIVFQQRFVRDCPPGATLFERSLFGFERQIQPGWFSP